MNKVEYCSVLMSRIMLIDGYLMMALENMDFSYVEKAEEVFVEIYENLGDLFRCEACNDEVDKCSETKEVS